MRNVMRIQSWMVLALAAALTACTSTGVREETPVAAGAAPIKKVMVLAVSQNPELRQTFEDQFVAKLKEQKVDAVQSYTIMAQTPTDANVVKQAVARSGADAVLVARLLKTQQMPDLGANDLYGSSLSPSGEPANTHPVFVTDVRLFDVQTATLTWGAVLQTIDPGDAKRAADDYSTRVVRAMRDRKII